MCIIIAKYRNGRLPTENELKNSFEYNSDGAGFMYTDNKKVIIDKGYMDYEKFINRFNELCKKYDNFKNKSFVIHCRIGTSSSNTAKNTHPYPLSEREKDLHKTYFETNLGVVHNGIISNYTPHWKNPTTNDTQEFIMRYLAPLYKNYKDFYKNKYIMSGIEDIISSKLVFLDTADKIYFVGKKSFIEEDKGLFFSNDSYKYNFTNFNLYDDLKFKGKGYYEEFINVYDNKNEKIGTIFYDDLEFLSENDWIVHNEDFEQISNDYTAIDTYSYDLYEIIDEKAYFIGNIFEDNIEIYSDEYKRII